MTTPHEHLAGLNNEQKEAAMHTHGPLLIVAGAGAGKTKTITHRIVNLIKQGIAPDKILAVTFTNKAAKEMRERILGEISKNFPGRENFAYRGLSQADEPRGSAPRARGDSDPEKEEFSLPFVSTFHSLGVYIIKENARLLGLTRYFNILDEGDANSMIKDILKELGIDPKQYDPKKIKGIISREKGKFIHIAEYAERESASIMGKIVAQVWNLYEQRKNKENSLDFDDLLLKATKLLKENEEIRKLYQDKWEFIHIDEYQDTNEVQYLMSRLLSEKNRNICVVGDYDQCLVGGTKIQMANGTLKSIEKIKKGELILSNYGSGDFRPAKITKTKNIKFQGFLTEIKTTGGRVLTSTPDHVHFAGYRLGTTPQLFLNYLMYKKNIGWRIGTTSIYTNGQKGSMAGFIQRSNQEHADATWVIGTYATSNQARIAEYKLSLKYQIPTIPFTPRKGVSFNGYVHDENALVEIFSSLDTDSSAKKMLLDLGLSREHPHHQPQNHNSQRRNINITLCADRRSQTPMHLISMSGNDDLGRKKLENLGFSVRKAKKGDTKSWRFETAHADYGKTCLLASKIASVFSDINIVFKARLGGGKINPKNGNSLPCIPASSVMPGMALFTKDGYDTVEAVSKIKTKKIKVYDLDVEKTHNFIANGIVTHNCIYSWRGANLKNILNFEKDYPNAKIILLEQNYRSTKNILEAANEVIKKNKYRPDKNLFTNNQEGEKIGLYEAMDETDEADFIATKILELLDRGSADNEIFDPAPFPFGAGPSDTKIPLPASPQAGDVAILYRANFQSRVIEEAMLRYNVPYQVLGVKFFERKEIKDTLAYLRAALNRDSLADIKRIINFPARGIGKVTLAKIFANDIEELPVKIRLKLNNFYTVLDEIRAKIETNTASQVIKYVVKKSGIEQELTSGTDEDLERLENIKELATLALKYDTLTGGAGVEKLLEDASLASDQDSLIDSGHKKETLNAVKLMTVHASKGLEFKYVFIAGLEDGLFPHERHGESRNGEDREEERRLFYVAITRAEQKVFLSFANFRTIFGSRQINTPSEFISDIPPDLLEREGEKGGIKTIYI